MNKVYLVKFAGGSWNDWLDTDLFVSLDKDHAEKVCVNLGEQLLQHKAHWSSNQSYQISDFIVDDNKLQFNICLDSIASDFQVIEIPLF